MATDGLNGRSRRNLREFLLEKASPLRSSQQTKTEDSKQPGTKNEDLGAKKKTRRYKHGIDITSERRNRKVHFRYGIGIGVGCKVGACDEILIVENHKPAAMESVPSRRSLLRAPETNLECCSHGISDLIRKKNSKKSREITQSSSRELQFPLPDDLLELCLLRLPFKYLSAARLVCKRWMRITTTAQFIKLRATDFSRSSWLFLFGVTREGSSGGEIYALDTFFDQWHTVRADSMSGRFFFSVIAIENDIYIVGGRSPVKKTHGEVFVFSPLSGKWGEACSLRTPRSKPVLCVLEVNSSSSLIFSSRSRRLKEHFYEEAKRTLPKSRFLMIAVGGRGSSDERLDSAEIYDSTADTWTAIKNPPADLGGAACSAAAYDGAFYLASETGQLARFDLEAGLWTRILTSSPPPRLQAYRPAIVSCDGRLFMLSVSWGRADKALRKLWELDLELMGWAEVSSHPDAPMDIGAVFVADRTRIYGVEMFRIFGQVLDFLTSCDVTAGEVKWKRFSTPHFSSSSCSKKSMVVIPL